MFRIKVEIEGLDNLGVDLADIIPCLACGSDQVKTEKNLSGNMMEIEVGNRGRRLASALISGGIVGLPADSGLA